MGKVSFLTQLSLASLLQIAGASGCVTGKTSGNEGEQPTVSWQLLPGDSVGGRSIQRFTINFADSVERLLFTQLPQPFKTLSDQDSIVEVNAGYYYVKSPLFGTDAKDITIDVKCEWGLRSISLGPESFHTLTGLSTLDPNGIYANRAS